MAQTFDSKSRTVGDILGNFERRPVTVPRFQRGFSWEKQHVLTFWSDVVSFRDDFEAAPKSATYFFGPIVIQNHGEEIQLLDGQQRLATVTILLAAIRDAARSLVFTKGHPGHDLAHEIQANLIQKEDSDPPFALRLGELDAEYFMRTVQTDPPEAMEPALRSHELIKSAQKTIREELLESISGLPPDDALRRLKQIKDAVAKGMLVVAISVESEDDAYNIFETLNDRGLRLSVPDLLLNLLMRRADSDYERGLVRAKWNYMLDQMGRRDISRFLRHMWLSRYGDLKSRGLFNELKNHLNENRTGSKDFADWCALDCDYYVALLDQTKDVPKAARNDVSGTVRYLGITSALPLLLAGLQSLTDDDFALLARAVSGLAVRYAVIADLNPSRLESAFYEAARRIRAAEDAKLSSAAILKAGLDVLAPLNPSNALVLEKAPQVNLERAPALWLMTQVANHLQTRTKEVAVDDANLEHIFPRNATTTQWPNKDALTPLIWRLGNLTILGEEFNRGASNKGYATKAANYYKGSELVITNSIPAKYQVWVPDSINDRSSAIATTIVEIFPE